MADLSSLPAGAGDPPEKASCPICAAEFIVSRSRNTFCSRRCANTDKARKQIGPNRVCRLNQRFGRLTVVREAGYDGKQTKWECLCDCGGIITTRPTTQ